MNGVIFDFNGTLYWDSKLHYEAWEEYSKMIRGTAFTYEEMRDKMFGHTNEDIIEYAIGKKPSKEMVEKYAKEKEAVYRKRCLLDPKNFKLAPGAVEFLDFLKENNILVGISVDGNRDTHDRYRKTKSGKGTFDIVCDRIKLGFASGARKEAVSRTVRMRRI